MKATIQYHDKVWYVVSEYAIFSEPKIRRLGWKVTSGERLGALNPDEHNGNELYRHDTGSYTVLSRNGYTGFDRISVRVAPDAQADFVEEEVFDCPKVRKNVETRYHDGRWQKYSKREGWIAA
jgi:hypothetical protein